MSGPSITICSVQDQDDGDRPPHLLETHLELPLLLPNLHWTALEAAAQRQGLTMGQLLRRLIAAYLTYLDDALVSPEPS
jgi:hypothetical protein